MKQATACRNDGLRSALQKKADCQLNGVRQAKESFAYGQCPAGCDIKYARCGVKLLPGAGN